MRKGKIKNMLDSNLLREGYKKLAILIDDDKNLHNLRTNYQKVRFSDIAVKRLQEHDINVTPNTEYGLNDLLDHNSGLEELLLPMLDDNTLVTNDYNPDSFEQEPKLSCTFDSEYVIVHFDFKTLEETIQISAVYIFKPPYVNRLRDDALKTEEYKDKMAKATDENRQELSKLIIDSYVQNCLDECVGNIKMKMEDYFIASDHPFQSELDNNEITFCLILDRVAMEEAWEKANQSGSGLDLAEYDPGRIFFTRAGKFVACMCNLSHIAGVLLPEDQEEFAKSKLDTTLDAIYDSEKKNFAAETSSATDAEQHSLNNTSDTQELASLPEKEEQKTESQEVKESAKTSIVGNASTTTSEAVVQKPFKEPEVEKKEGNAMPTMQETAQIVSQNTYHNPETATVLKKLQESQNAIDELEGRNTPTAGSVSGGNNKDSFSANFPKRSKRKKNKNKRRNDRRNQGQKNDPFQDSEEKSENTNGDDASADVVANASLEEAKENLTTTIENSVETTTDDAGFDEDFDGMTEDVRENNKTSEEDEDDDLMPEIPPEAYDKYPDLQTLKDRLYAQSAEMDKRNKRAMDARKANLDRFGKSLKARSDELAEKQKKFQQGISEQEASIEKKKADAEAEAKNLLEEATRKAQEVRDKTAALIKDSKRDLEHQRQMLQEERDLLKHDRQTLEEERQLFESEKAVQETAPEFVYTRVDNLEAEVERLKGLGEENKKLSALHESSEQKIRELTEQMSTMVPQEMASIDVDGYRRMESAVAKLKGERLELRKSINAYKQHVATQKEAIDAFVAELATNEQQVSTLTGQVEELQSTLTQKHAELTELEAQKNQVTTEYEEYRKRYSATSTAVSKEQREQIQSLSETLTEKQAEIDSLNKQMNSLNGQLDTLKSENQSLRDKVSTMASEDLSKHMESVPTGNSIAYSAEEIRAEMQKIGIDLEVVAAEGRPLLQGHKDNVTVTFNFENELAIVEKTTKRPTAYLDQISDWNAFGGATCVYYMKKHAVECKIDYRVRPDSTYLREHSLSEVIKDVLEQFQQIKK